MAKSIPCGSWPSPIRSERIASGALRLSQPRLDGDWVYWLEGRPREGGRQVIMRAGAADGSGRAEVSPTDVNVRSRVHEYGGGDYAVARGVLDYVNFADQQIYRLVPGEFESTALTTSPEAAYADCCAAPSGRWLAAVEERKTSDGEPENRIALLPLDPREQGQADLVCAQGDARWDFVSFPTFSPDGRQLAFTCWNHPDMPWDATTLQRVDLDERGRPASAPELVAGNGSESIFQPRFAPDGALTFISDRSGWWNLYRETAQGVRCLAEREAEFGGPQWVFGLSRYDFIGADEILCAYGAAGGDRLARLDVASGELSEIDLPFTSIEGIRVHEGRACFIAASPSTASAVYTLDLDSNAICEVQRGNELELESEWLSTPSAISFPSAGGRIAHAFFYPPKNPEATIPDGERPPLLVKSHGGPTASASTALDLRIQYWTSRGFAVVDVNYAGSTGYGRAYRKLLDGQWGIADVEDCVAAARYLADADEVDSGRLAISGGSAGGYTTLCALTFHDTFAAGASHYGIGDLEALAQDTHKFESRYMDRLIAPYPNGRAIYRERSPIHFTERLDCPVIFFQGLEDRVVPPNQAEAMVEALAKRGLRRAYVAFPGEQHGFRKAENICTALDGELYFYSVTFGFDVDVRPEAVRIEEG